MRKVNTDNSRIGDISELSVIAHYLSIGWEVFRNQGSTGPIDIILFNRKTGETKLIDVKTTKLNGGKGKQSYSLRKPTEEQIKLGIEITYYEQETGKIGTFDDFPTSGEINDPRRKRIQIGKVIYSSKKAAAAAVNVSITTIFNRVNSNEWPHYKELPCKPVKEK